MTRDELWHALDDLASQDAPTPPRTEDLVGPATRLRRRRWAGRSLLTVVGAGATAACVVLGASVLDTGPSGPAPATTVVAAPDPGVAPVPTASSAPSPDPVRIDAGGGTVGAFGADRGFTGGSVSDHPERPVSASGVRSPAPLRVYQSCRFGARLSYRIGGLAPGRRHLVRLHWAEMDFQRAGQRVFAVAVNGRTVLPRLDVVAVTGARWRALVREVATAAADDGSVTVTLTRAGADNPFLSGLEVLPTG